MKPKAKTLLKDLLRLCDEAVAGHTTVAAIGAIPHALKGDDFIVFNNAGITSFDIWRGAERVKALLDDKKFVDNYVYFAKLGETEVVKRIPYLNVATKMIGFSPVLDYVRPHPAGLVRFVRAASRERASKYALKMGWGSGEWRYLSGGNDLRGYRNIELHQVGSWWNHPNSGVINDELRFLKSRSDFFSVINDP